MNKKAQMDTGYSSAGNAIKAIVFLLFATFSGGALAYTVNDAVSNTITMTEESQEFLVIESVKNCLVYEENGRVYYDTINPADITDAKLEECFPNRDVAVVFLNSEGEQIRSAETGLSSRVGKTPEYFKYNIPGSIEIHKLGVTYSG